MTLGREKLPLQVGLSRDLEGAVQHGAAFPLDFLQVGG